MKISLSCAVLVVLLCSACASSASDASGKTPAGQTGTEPTGTAQKGTGIRTAPSRAALKQLLISQADVPAGFLLEDSPESDAQSTEPADPAPTDCAGRFQTVGDRQPGQVDQVERQFSAPKDGDAAPSGFVQILTSYSSADSAATSVASLKTLVKDCASYSYDVNGDHHDLQLSSASPVPGASGFAFDVDETITPAEDDSSVKFNELRKSRVSTVSNGPVVSQVLGSRVLAGDDHLLERLTAIATQHLATAG